MLLKCTKTSLPSGLMMKPNPFFESNHLTFPVGMAVLPQKRQPRHPAQGARRAACDVSRPRASIEIERDARTPGPYIRRWKSFNDFSFFCGMHSPRFT